jgi:putative ABC transport system permease protein
MLSDIRYAFRTLRQSRGFTATALIALALGIGANTAMFSVVYAVLLKPLPYRQPDQLTWLTLYNKLFKAEFVTGRDFLDWRDQNTSFDLLAAVDIGGATVTGIAEPFGIRTSAFSEPVGRIFGVQPTLGRDFLPEELQPHATSHPALISNAFFHRYFHGDRAALGAKLVLDDGPVTVVGVMPADFRLPLPDPGGSQTEAEAILPLAIDPATQHRSGRGIIVVQVIGRHKPGVSLATARTEIATLQSRVPGPSHVETVVEPLRDRLLGNTTRLLLILLGAVAFVLLIACANVANLLLVRAAGRAREMAVRMALGAGRGRLIRQALEESILLAIGGGAAGLFVAAWTLRLIVHWSVVTAPRLKDAQLDSTVVVFAFVLSAFTGILFGIVPAFAATRTNINWALKSAGPQSGRRRLGGMLVVAEVALSLVLLAGAGLMLKSLWLMHASASAAAPERVLTASLLIENPRANVRTQSAPFVTEFASQLESLPGVRAASFTGASGRFTARLESWPEHAVGQTVPTDVFDVGPHFFTAAGIRLVQGRLLTESDGTDSPPVMVINEALARRFAPNYPRESPIGLRVPMPFGVNDKRTSIAIIGVVAEYRRQLDAPVNPQMFRPIAQTWLPPRGVQLMVRAHSDPTALIGAIRGTGRPDGIALLNPQTLADRLDDGIAARRFEMTLLIAFAGLALLLALVGIYGVVSHMVAQRTREIGVRVALGAQRGDVVRLVLSGGLSLVCAGVVLGLAGSLGLTRVMESFLYGVKPTDAVTFVAASVLLVAVAALAAWIPARRAAAVDPLIALRYE